MGSTRSVYETAVGQKYRTQDQGREYPLFIGQKDLSRNVLRLHDYRWALRIMQVTTERA